MILCVFEHIMFVCCCVSFSVFHLSVVFVVCLCFVELLPSFENSMSFAGLLFWISVLCSFFVLSRWLSLVLIMNRRKHFKMLRDAPDCNCKFAYNVLVLL